MPPTANSISGKTSVWSSPDVEAWRSASVPGSAAAWPANAETPPSRWRSAKSSTPPMPKTRITPQRNSGGAVERERPLHREVAAGDAAAERLQVACDQDGPDERGDQAAQGQHGLHDVPQVARQERLDEDAGARDAEHGEDGPELGVLDGGLDELVHEWSSSPVGTGVETVGPSSVTPTSTSVRSTVGLITSSRGIG